MSNKIKKIEKRERIKRESAKKRRMRSIGLIIIGFVALFFDAALARMALKRYNETPDLQAGTLGIIASVLPHILLAMIIMITILLLLKQNKKR